MDKRTIIFILASIAIWFLYIQFVAPRFAPPKQPAPAHSAESPASDKSLPAPDGITQTAKATPVASEKPESSFSQPANIAPRQKVLENDYIKVTLSNKGAAIESLVLKQYKSAKLSLQSDTASQLSVVNTADPYKYALSVSAPDSGDDLASGLWEAITETDSSITFRYVTVHGLAVHKSFTLGRHNYALDFSVGLENLSANPLARKLIIHGLETMPPESYNASDITALYSYTDPPVTDTARGKEVKWYIEQPAPAKVKKEADNKSAVSFTLIQGQDNVYWNGIANKYFAAILVPANIADIGAYGFKAIDCPALPNNSSPYQNLNFYIQTKEFTLNPKESRNLDFLFYAGPKKAADLAVFSDLGFDKLLSYGWFGFISKILLLILGGLFALFKNYGAAIVVLTIVVKVVMFPVTKKGQVSMYQMQKLQPRIKALQEQYKNDKRRFGEEQLKLFKEYGVNPLSGCLPMLLQIPVFIGLYWALAQAIELRQSPFMLWITDLSQPDQLCKLPFPILGAHYLHVLPLIMTVSWLIQSFTQPKSPDPQARQQQKMFLFMPLVFGILFYSVPSGLTLYWFTSTLLGIGEQILIKKYYFR
ncbi:MAG: membrane protein insertase YidC [Planctomycetota bacterium]